MNCYGGANRSAAIVVAWLLVREGVSLRETMHRVAALRGQVLTNHMFRLQLLRLSMGEAVMAGCCRKARALVEMSTCTRNGR